MFNPIPILGLIPNLLGYWQKQQELKLRWYELIVKVLCDLVRFTIAHIRIICICLILAYCFMKYMQAVGYGKAENKQKIIAQKALNDHVKADSDAAKKREAENKLNAILAQKKTAVKALEHQQAISTILLKGKANEVITKRTITHLRGELRDRIEGYQTARLLENDTSGLASRNSDPAVFGQLQEELATCKEAGAIAAADFNFCKSYVEVQQSILGVTK